MTNFRVIPPIETFAGDGIVQTIEMRDGKSIVGVARWHASPGEQGVMQVLELWIAPAQQRAGLGGQLLRESIAQARAYFAGRSVRFRRVWISVEQKSQVNARAFLTQQGFHHVATIKEMLARQDALVYLKSMD